jgi:hypothetical protein
VPTNKQDVDALQFLVALHNKASLQGDVPVLPDVPLKRKLPVTRSPKKKKPNTIKSKLLQQMCAKAVRPAKL